MNEPLKEQSRELPYEPPSKTPELLNPIVLAYAGDAVFELLVRQHLLAQRNLKPHHLHREATGMVSAKGQRQLLERWAPMLSEEEADIVRRGRNAKSGQSPRNADPADYKQATALESLMGYLYYKGRTERIRELMAAAFSEKEAERGKETGNGQ
ncbi:MULTISPECIES: ribonuclease III domain-containing protein [unclassified Paenibacillus]|uniref:Mini-ribonuclease 3 n=1 Tax=unclassified Paenibacillus TaxID=185978 RepID=UPI00095734DE|nr:MULTISPECIES: ribonuclease III domain-containing protein [unclassified Paenibacillus]ASS68185.1 ribonuclease III [Paenibacillus sp. RUD330]SIR70300.1 ribonuclease-3 family protein [Paenibacillus sp. RU4X]SIR77527.1 ribonuclease-3 family protein [Paenibacillus sp. RU4T]